MKSLVSEQDKLTAIQGTITTNLVDLYKSLGGSDPLDLIDVKTRQEMLKRTE